MRRLTGLATAPLVLILDQATKVAALRTLGSEGNTLLLVGPVDLTLVFNRSNAFGLVPDVGAISRWALVTFNIAVAAALIHWAVRRERAPLSIWAVGFLVAGALGNAVDRLRLGVVIDFVDLSRVGFHWVFNVADASVDVGIALMLFALLRTPGNQGKPAATGLR